MWTRACAHAKFFSGAVESFVAVVTGLRPAALACAKCVHQSRRQIPVLRSLSRFGLVIGVMLTACFAQVEAPRVVPLSPTLSAGDTKKRVMVIPVREAIDSPVLYILRRGLKEAIEQKMDAVILDMDTPGGSLGTTFEILEALEKFEGQTITYINKDAVSAGAFIAAATHEKGVLGEGRILGL